MFSDFLLRYYFYVLFLTNINKIIKKNKSIKSILKAQLYFFNLFIIIFINTLKKKVMAKSFLSENYKRRIQQLAGIQTVANISENKNVLKKVISESKKTEELGLGILTKSGIEQEEALNIINIFKADESKNQKNIPIMAFIYAKWNKDAKLILKTLNDYNELEENKYIKPIVLEKEGLSIGDKSFTDFLKFSEYIHGLQAEKKLETNRSELKKKQGDVASNFKSEKKSIWSGNGIEIYDGFKVGKCIEYTMGGLTGKAYSFCIGQPGNTMHKSYRDQKESTFYFIVDRNHFKIAEDGNVDLSDPLHIVVFDNTNMGLELTDANNNTGKIAEPYGTDTEKYIQYLEEKGVPIDKMLINKQKTEEEIYEDNLLEEKNKSLDWFKNLERLAIKDGKVDELGNPNFRYYQSAYIGRGHSLSDEQFDYLMEK